ncbi:MAG: hypothetical protein K0R78_217 [Pelosinus sp.]|nr:hypothetical protein [Pelosinus sp.]
MRKITSIILALAFVIVSVTGVQMAMGGTGKRPDMKSATIQSNTVASNNVNASRHMPFYPKKAHEWMGYIFIIAGVAHIAYNFTPLVSYVKKKP